MNSTKTFILLKTLSKKEMDGLSVLVKKNKRESLYKLFSLLKKVIKQKRNTSVKSFFELFYKKPYNKKDDNLLRNELRLLNNIIEQFIVDNSIAKELKQNEYLAKKHYLNYLLKQESYDLLDKELNKVFKQIQSKEDFVFLYDFFMIWTQMHGKNFKMESKYFSETKENFNQLFSFWVQEVGIKTRKIEIFKAFINRGISMVDRTFEFEENLTKLNFDENNDNNYFNFLSNKSNSIKATAEKKIEILLDMNEQLKKIKSSDFNSIQEKFTVLQYLGIEYMIQSDYESASTYFEESLSLSKSIDENSFTKGLYNYVSTQIKLKHFDNAIKMFHEHFEKIKQSNIIDLFYCIITMSYVFTGDILKAEKTNRVIDSNKSVGNFLYSRCNLAIIFYENDLKELALNELTNIVQSVNYHKNQDIAFKDFTSFFKSFIQNSYTKSLVIENIVKLEKMNQTILDNFKKSSISYGSDSLHLFWLQQKIQAVLSS